MPNLFVNLSVPVQPLVPGPAVSVAGLSADKSVVLVTTPDTLVVIEGSTDGGNQFVPVWRSDAPSPMLRGVFEYLRAVRTRGHAPISLRVGAPTSATNQFASLDVPIASNGVGTYLDTSLMGPVKTFVLAGAYSGVISIEGSNTDGASYESVGQFDSGGSAAIFVRGAYGRMRVRTARAGGSPSVSLGAEDDSSGTGAQGFQGAQGGAGAQGAQGGAGAQGSQGGAGAQGSQGGDGAQGGAGAQGSQGSQGDSSAASWTGLRHYAVDKTNGNDANLGYGATKALAGANAVQTIGRLLQILGQVLVGRAGQSIAIWAATPADLSTYAEDFVLSNLQGFDDITIAGTGTNATAGAVAFSGSAADQIYAGAKLVSGTQSAGYLVSAASTTTSWDCLRASDGGAPALAAEPALTHKRIRFDVATPTVALQNVCRDVWKNDTNTIYSDDPLPVAPATGGAGVGDVFYIEEPGFQPQKFVLSSVKARAASGSNLVDDRGLRVWGVRQSGGGTGFANFRDCGVVSTAFFHPGAGESYADCEAVFSAQTIRDDQLVVRNVGGNRSGSGQLATSSYFRNKTTIVSSAGAGLVNASDILDFQYGEGCSIETSVNLLDGMANASIGGNVTKLRTRRVSSGVISGVATRTSIYGVLVELSASSILLELGPIGTSFAPFGFVSVDNIISGTGGGFTIGVDVFSTNVSVLIGYYSSVFAFSGSQFDTLFTAPDGTAASTGAVSIDDLQRTAVRDTYGNYVVAAAVGAFKNAGAGYPRGVTTNGDAISQWDVLRSTSNGEVGLADATSSANCSFLVGVNYLANSSNPGETTTAMACEYVLVNLEADPASVPCKLYVATTPGKATDIPPASPNFVECIGTLVEYFAGESKGIVQWSPDQTPVPGV